MWTCYYIYLSFLIKRKYAKNICKSLGLFADCVCVKSEHLQSLMKREDESEYSVVQGNKGKRLK